MFLAFPKAADEKRLLARYEAEDSVAPAEPSTEPARPAAPRAETQLAAEGPAAARAAERAPPGPDSDPAASHVKDA